MTLPGFVVAITTDDLFGARAIIRKEKDDGVLEGADGFEFIENAADFAHSWRVDVVQP